MELLLLVVLAVLWGASYSLIHVALESLPALTLMAWRVAVAAMLLTAVAVWRQQRFPRSIALWRDFGVQAVFNSIGAWTLLAWGQQHVDSAVAGVLNSTSPVFVIALTAFWTRHEAVPRLRVVGGALGLLGVAVMFDLPHLGGDATRTLAHFAVVGGALLYACAAIYGARFRSVPDIVVAAATMIWATAVLCPLAWLVDAPWHGAPIQARSVIAATALAVFSTAIAMLLYFRLLRTLGSVRVASQSYLRAMLATIFGVIFLDESLAPHTVIGIALVIVGMLAIHTPCAQWAMSINPRSRRNRQPR